LVLNKAKAPERKRKILLIEASRDFGNKTTQNVLRDEDVKKIAATFHAFRDVDKYARVVTLDDIASNEFNLNLSRYLETADAAAKVDVASALARLRMLERARTDAEAKMNAHLARLGYGG